MSTLPAPDPRAEALLILGRAERRSKLRFPLDLRMSYQTLGRFVHAGTGWVVNMSSTGMLISDRFPLPVGVRMELNVAWPSMLDGQVGLQLVALGRVVRAEAAGFAITLARPQFRTISRRRSSAVIAIDRGLELIRPQQSSASRASGLEAAFPGSGR